MGDTISCHRGLKDTYLFFMTINIFVRHIIKNFKIRVSIFETNPDS
jgi:hypothetical protein